MPAPGVGFGRFGRDVRVATEQRFDGLAGDYNQHRPRFVRRLGVAYHSELFLGVLP